MHNYYINIGIISAASGVKGYVKIRYFTEKGTDLTTFQNIFDSNGKSYKLKILNIKKDYVIASIEGITSRNEAEKLTNTILMIERSELAKTNTDEFYYADLLGMTVLSANGKLLGIVKNILNFGASDIIEVFNANSIDSFYYPFIKNFVLSVDLENRCLVLNQAEEIVDIE